jgi:transposase
LIAYWHVIHDHIDYADLGPVWPQRRRSTEHRTDSSTNSNNSGTVTLEPTS